MMMMMSLNGKHAFALPHSSLPEPKYSALHASSTASSTSSSSPPSSSSSSSSVPSSSCSSTRLSSSTSTTEAMRRACLPTPPSNIFGGLDESLLARAEALAAVDIVSPTKSHHHHHQHPHHQHQHHAPHHSPFKPDATYHTMNALPCTSSSSSSSSSSSVPITHPSAGHHHHHHHHHHHQPHQALEGDLLEHLTPGGLALAPDGSMVSAAPGAHMSHMAAAAAIGMAHAAHTHGLPGHAHGLPPPPPHAAGCMSDVDADPRDLEAFAERFKQRRIKLGVTQADVGAALANLKIPGVGSLSQSTICRFESLTLSHNNMIALKPILHAWLEEAEKSHRDKLSKPELFNGAEKKRKRTSIAAPEKRSLEAYFAIQPRPSSEKIAAIAEKLDLKKNVVRVWFCNQRQKQKRMKYSACV
ncbi:POU domain, class 4, transcription factor 2 [Hoplias malabaricus]|uniref:POU domain, class 4, transcription factor 2 n=1 Tax=Hoplias malabaricus TaxID=27720 RepID=UPI00346356A1